MGAKLDLVGQTFGRLHVVSLAVGKRVRSWNCNCACGGSNVVSTGNLRSGTSRSCGCATVEATVKRSTKHGMAPRGERPGLYVVWKGMRQRCNDPNATNFEWYGGRGIKVCKEWDNFAAFSAWALKAGYAPGLEIERTDNSIGYGPDNCRWATHQEQMLNTRGVRLVECNGRMVPVSQAARELGVKYTTLAARTRRAAAASSSRSEA